MAKRQALKLHRWLGIILLLPLLLQTATGLMLVYKWPLAQWLDPDGMQRKTNTPDLTAGQITDRAAASWNDASMTRLYFPASANGTFFLLLKNHEGEQYYGSIDPGDGRVLREGSRWQFPVEAALQLHFQPLPGWPGNTVVLLTGSGLLTLIIAAVVAWWPRPGRWRQGLTIRGGLRPRLMVRQVHRSLGIILLPVLAVIATTGGLMALEIALDNAAAAAPAAQQNRAVPPGRHVDAALALAQQVVPGAQLRDISFPGGNIKVQFHAPERNQRAVHAVLLGGAPPGSTSLQVLKHWPAQDNTAWWVSLLPIHSGDVVRPWGPRVVLAAGVALFILCSLGAYLWLPEKARRA